MNKRIAITTVTCSIIGLAIAVLCVTIGPIFQSLFCDSLPSLIGEALACLTYHNILSYSIFFIVPMLQWGLFGYAVAYDVWIREKGIRISILVGIAYVILSILSIPILVSTSIPRVHSDIPVVVTFHILLGGIVAVLPVLLTFNQQKRKAKYLLIISIITVILTVSLGMYIRNKPTGCLYSVNIRQKASTKLYEITITNWNGHTFEVSVEHITVLVPDEVTVTWKTALPGGKEYLAKQEQLFREYLLFKKDNPNKEPEHNPWDDEVYPKDKFQEHKVAVVLKDKIPKKLKGKIAFTIKDDEQVDVSYTVNETDQ